MKFPTEKYMKICENCGKPVIKTDGGPGRRTWVHVSRKRTMMGNLKAQKKCPVTDKNKAKPGQSLHTPEEMEWV